MTGDDGSLPPGYGLDEGDGSTESCACTNGGKAAGSSLGLLGLLLLVMAPRKRR